MITDISHFYKGDVNLGKKQKLYVGECLMNTATSCADPIIMSTSVFHQDCFRYLRSVQKDCGRKVEEEKAAKEDRNRYDDDEGGSGEEEMQGKKQQQKKWRKNK